MASPLIANVYLHYLFDLWADVWRRKMAKGNVIITRYADDLVLGFQHRTDAERFLGEFKERLAKFGLELHPDKTRLIEFGRFAARDRKRRGEGKPETFNFLGFTHYCGQRHKKIVAILSQQLSWSHFRELLPLTQPLQREFYAERCRIEGWSVRTLRGRIDSILYERTALSKKPDELAKQELASLRHTGAVGPALVLKNPYILDFTISSLWGANEDACRNCFVSYVHT